MIGTAPAASALAAVVLCALVMGGGGRDPAPRLAADEIVRERTTRALAAVQSLERALVEALGEARTGASLAVDATSPSERLDAAAALVEGAADDADAVQRAVAALERARRARDPGAAPLPAPVTEAELAGIADGLRAAGPSADAAAEMRSLATRLLERLEAARVALRDGRFDAARDAAAGARADHEAVSGARVGSETLPVWLAATDAIISAVTRLIDATEAGDSDAAAAATRELAELAGEAAVADRALDVAVAEAADAASREPLARLGAAVAAMEGLRAALDASAEAS